MPSSLTAFSFIAEGSEATPGLFNTIFSTLSNNIGTVNVVSSAGSFTAPASGTSATVAINANSNFTDYLFLNDNSNSRSDYIIGSHVGGTADGLNIWDNSGQTMIASFSKQSIRFFQNVVGPVFNTAGDLVNAATIGVGTDSVESRIQAAITQAISEGKSLVLVPASMLPYAGSLISSNFTSSVRMVTEGGDWSTYDTKAYGCKGDNSTDDASAFSALANRGIPVGGGTIYASGPATYRIASSVITVPQAVSVQPGPGALFSIGSQATLVVSGPFQAAPEQSVFTTSTAGGVVFGTGVGTAVYARWFGALGDGVTNDSYAVWRAAKAVTASGGGALRFGPGIYLCTASFYTSNVIVEGAGPSITTLRQPATAYRSISDASMTNGSFLLASQTAAFTSSDLSKTAWVFQAGAVTTEDLLGIISRISSSTQVLLDTAAGATVSGKAARIGAARNVLEFGRTDLGNHASQSLAVGVRNLSVDGNRSNVSGPADSADDLTNHGIIFTNTLRPFVEHIRAVDCHMTGLDFVITAQHARTNDVFTYNCGNSTTGHPGFDVNSSSYGHFVGLSSESCFVGFRLLDNCFGNIVDVAVRYSQAQAAIFNNQNTNFSTGNIVRVSAQECGRGPIAGRVHVSTNMYNNVFDITAVAAGGTFVVSNGSESLQTVWQHDGILIGSEGLSDQLKPQGNVIRATARKCGGNGIIVRGNYNDITAEVTENAQAASLSYYGLEVNGSWNQIRANLRDTQAIQRGIAVRTQGGEVGTPATQNMIICGAENPTSPFDDSGTSTRYIGMQLGTLISKNTLWSPEIWASPSGVSALGSIVTSSYVSSTRSVIAGGLWGSGLSIGNATAGGTLIPAISSTSSKIGAFVVQGSASSFTLVVWAAAQPGDQIMITPFGAGVSSLSSGLVAHSHCTKAGQVEMRLSNVSTLAQNQSSISWYLTRISPF